LAKTAKSIEKCRENVLQMFYISMFYTTFAVPKRDVLQMFYAKQEGGKRCMAKGYGKEGY